jgi:hypothetical protein
MATKTLVFAPEHGREHHAHILAIDSAENDHMDRLRVFVPELPVDIPLLQTGVAH